MVKAVIVDCFGVIVGKGFENTFALAGGNPKQDKSFIETMLQKSNLGLITEQNFNSVMAKHLGQTKQQWQNKLSSVETANTDLLNYILSLRKDYKTALLSNSNKGVLESKIGQAWLDKCFDEVVCSAEVGLVKPDPKIYRLTAARLGLQPNECVFVDDHQSFVDAAEQIGMHGIVYEGLDQLKQSLSCAINR